MRKTTVMIFMVTLVVVMTSGVSFAKSIFKSIGDEDIEAVQKFVENGGDVNKRGSNGLTPLMSAVCEKEANIKIVNILVNAGADVNATDTLNTPILLTAVFRDRTDIVQTLVDSKVNIDVEDAFGTPVLSVAIYKGRTEIVQILIDAGADVNIEDAFGTPAILSAIHEGQTKIVSILIDAGVDINANLFMGMTALDFALLSKHKERDNIIKILKENGAK